MKLEELVGKSITEAQFDEAAGKKDACYHKVKSRYDVWPSAYASGALVKCRKVGAKNWGNKSKKEGLDDLKALPKDLKKSIKKNREEGVNENIDSQIDTLMKQKERLMAKRPVPHNDVARIQGRLNALRAKKGKENVNEARDPIIDKMDRKTKITFSKSLSPRLNHLKGKTLIVVKKGINLFNVLPDGAKYNPANVRTIEAPVLLRMMKNRAITKIIDGKGKVLHNVKEGVIKENPAAIAAAQRMVVQNKSGNKISVNTARQSSYAQKDPSTHKKAKSLFQRIKDKFKKKESVDEGRGTCWVGYQQKGMKEKNGRMVPNCVKEIYEIYYEVNGEGHGYTFEHIKENNLNEAEYQGRKVKLGKIMQGDVKKFKVYVKNPKGNVVKVNFGQGGDAKGGTMRIRKSNPKARANFRARHNCDNPGPRHKARYWSCRKW